MKGFLWSEILAAQGRRPEDVSEEITWLKKLQARDKTVALVNQLKAIVGQGPLNQAADGDRDIAAS